LSKLKYAKYIITEVNPEAVENLPIPRRIREQREKGNYVESSWMFTLDNTIAKGAFYTNCVWLWEKKGPDIVELEIAHTHDFDETLGFVGTVRGNPHALGGEIEFWLEDEKFVLEKSCLVYVPRGMKHLPLYVRRIDSPIFFWTAGNGTSYTRSSGHEDM
jgi:hypothetical protein